MSFYRFLLVTKAILLVTTTSALAQPTLNDEYTIFTGVSTSIFGGQTISVENLTNSIINDDTEIIGTNLIGGMNVESFDSFENLGDGDFEFVIGLQCVDPFNGTLSDGTQIGTLSLGVGAVIPDGDPVEFGPHEVNSAFLNSFDSDGNSVVSFTVTSLDPFAGGVWSGSFSLASGNFVPDSVVRIELHILGTLLNTTILGDVNLDGVVNLLDVGPFVDLISNAEFQTEADIDGNGNVDLLDVGPFVDLLSS